MKFLRQVLSLAVAAVLLYAVPLRIWACGPSYTEPVFVFTDSPDIPFDDFAGGNIGLVRPTFGRKALFIAYRYINGGGFSAWEQKPLVEAMRGTPPEDGRESTAVDAWVEARKLVETDEKASAIYTERTYGGYNFFPNCTKNAFETAVETLKDRASLHGSDDPFVREWLHGQDQVFDICSSGNTMPAEPTPGSPDWFVKDRNYQIAAAHFYALNFDEARRRFQDIASDGDSPWQQTADYLVARTLVRQGSLTKDEAKKRLIYEDAEDYLKLLISRSGKLRFAAEQMLGLVKYRIRPEERVGELAHVLSTGASGENLRQDLIDYTWLLDKFEANVLRAVKEQKEKAARREKAAAIANLAPDKREPIITPLSNSNTNSAWPGPQTSWQKENESIERGETIRISFSYQVPGKEYPDYLNQIFKSGVTDEEVIQHFAEKIGRPLKDEESAKALESKAEALAERRRLLGANHRFGSAQPQSYEGSDYYGADVEFTTEMVPEFLRRDDLTDWIFTYQLEDAMSYERAAANWHDRHTSAWLIAALAKAAKTSPGVERLMRDADTVGASSPAYPTVAYHVARLKIEQGKDAEARKLLDDLIGSRFDNLPVSTQNAFLEMRMGISQTMAEFLRFATRRPVTFSRDSNYGKLRDFMEEEKGYWDPKYYKETKAEYTRGVEDSYRELLPWDDRSAFDERIADVLNRHFSLDLLAQTAVDPALPDYLRRQMILTAWTRAEVLGRDDVAVRFAKEAVRSQPDTEEMFWGYLSARTRETRRVEALWIMIKNPRLTVFVKSGIPESGENETSGWEDGWWVEPVDTEYDRKWNQVPKKIPRPLFITPEQSEQARAERKQIVANGDGETYLSNRVLEWAKKAPRDRRVPEALYIVATINLQTKYGDGSPELRDEAKKLLQNRYRSSRWNAEAQKDPEY